MVESMMMLMGNIVAEADGQMPSTPALPKAVAS